MPKGRSPYLPLAQTINKGCAARGVFLYVIEGHFGDSWCTWAPPEVMARMPELLHEAADQMEVGGRSGQTTVPLAIITPMPAGEQYQDLCEHACRLASARACFLYVLEGRDGSGWAAFAPPEIHAPMLAELIRGFAHDMKPEEARLREAVH